MRNMRGQDVSRLSELRQKYALDLDPEPWQHSDPELWDCRYDYGVWVESNSHLLRWDPRPGYDRIRENYGPR
jgi:hypothetical protein